MGKGLTTSVGNDPTTNGLTLSNIYLLDLKGEQVSELNGSGQLVHTNVYANGELLATILPVSSAYPNGDTQFALHDWLGTKRVTLGASGCAQTWVQYPYGDGLVSNGTLMAGQQLPTCSGDATEHHFTGKERDSESGLDYFGARYYQSSMGRWMTPDPVGQMMQKLIDPQQWTMYSYGRDEPLATVDRNGKWPTNVHNEVIDKAFPGLTDHQRAVLKASSKSMDGILNGGQSMANAYEHAMRAPNESPELAKLETKMFIADKEDLARSQAGSSGGTASAINDQSLATFGQAAHTAADSTSPEHVDPVGNPMPWDPTSPLAVIEHVNGEATPTGEQKDAAVKAIQKEFEKTYGAAAAAQAFSRPTADEQDLTKQGIVDGSPK